MIKEASVGETATCLYRVISQSTSACVHFYLLLFLFSHSVPLTPCLSVTLPAMQQYEQVMALAPCPHVKVFPLSSSPSVVLVLSVWAALKAKPIAVNITLYCRRLAKCNFLVHSVSHLPRKREFHQDAHRSLTYWLSFISVIQISLH